MVLTKQAEEKAALTQGCRRLTLRETTGHRNARGPPIAAPEAQSARKEWGQLASMGPWERRQPGYLMKEAHKPPRLSLSPQTSPFPTECGSQQPALPRTATTCPSSPNLSAPHLPDQAEQLKGSPVLPAVIWKTALGTLLSPRPAATTHPTQLAPQPQAPCGPLCITHILFSGEKRGNNNH